MTIIHSLRTALPAAALLLISACGGGGGGGGGGSAEPTVTAMSAPTNPKYSDTLLVTLTGTNLDAAGVSVASPGCKNMTRSTTAPNVSDASTAYYSCTVSAVGAQTVTATRVSDAAVLQSAAFTVAQPKVQFAITNSTGTYNGTMEFTLDPSKAPVTVDNFLRYVRDGFYANTIYHRVVTSPVPFVIQGGGYRTNAARGLFSPIPLEVNKGLSNVKWSVAMARTSAKTDPAAPNTATSQFFINLADNSGTLDPHPPTNPSDDGLGYAVFGSVTAGTDVVTAISTAPCAPLTSGTTVITAGNECTPQPYMIMASATQTQ